MLWFTLAIVPLVEEGRAGDGLSADVAVQYICSVRWAFSVMSNTEAGARYCLYEEHAATYPRHRFVLENAYIR